MDIYQNFSGKSVFFTGVTGFVGKVFLWKLLKEFPDLEHAIVLIRTKKGQKPQDRLEKEVLSSMCFEPLRQAIGEEEWTRRRSKVIAVSGDIMYDRLGLSEADYEMVCAKTHFIVHMAATVNFDERLDISVKMNVLGSMRVLSMAQRCAKLQAYVHMSTCYVNYARHGRHQSVRETVYPLPFEAEDMCKFILAQEPSMLKLVTGRVLSQYGFPNTYTMTKSMAEQILERRKGTLPLVIVRPSIVGCAWREPVPGWVDALTAAGGIYLTAGLGILREIHCPPSNISDIVPVDYVVNTTIKMLHRTSTYHAATRDATMRTIAPSQGKIATSLPVAVSGKSGGGVERLTAAAVAISANQNASNAAAVAQSSGESDGTATLPFVYQASTSSSLNVMRWETASAAVHEYWNKNPHPKSVGPCDMHLMDNYYKYKLRFIFVRALPVKFMKIGASLPIIGSPQKRQLVERLEKAVFRAADMQRQFAPFTVKEWCFDATNTNSLDEALKPEHVKAFSCDPYDINWHAYTVAYSYGMIRYIMKAADGRSPPTLPESGSQVFLKASL